MLRAALLVLAATLATSSAEARPRHSLLFARVEVGDLNLQSPTGATAMLRHLDAAARELCATPRSPLLPGHEGRAWRCRRDAVTAAVERLRTPALTLAYDAWLSAEPDAEPQARHPG